MGGKVVLSGGIDVVLLENGPRPKIKEECFKYLKAFNRCGGYILQDGFNVPPGTPLEHLDEMVRSSEEFSKIK